MISYDQYLRLSQSANSEERSQAAHLAALSYVDHKGPDDEQAALYAALISFLDDDSVKVRASLAYGLLHTPNAPRPVILSLLHDVPIIARAIAQYSPILVDADLLGIIKTKDRAMIDAIAQRPKLGQRVVKNLLEFGDIDISLKVLRRKDLTIDAATLTNIAHKFYNNGQIRSALFSRKDLPASARMFLVEKVCDILSNARIVKGAIAPRPLERLMRDLLSSAITKIGENEASIGVVDYAQEMVEKNQLTTRILLHSVVSGDVLFFSQCLFVLSNIPEKKIFSLLNDGSRAALNALFVKCGIDDAIKNLLTRLVFYARSVDLGRDLSSRHLIVTCLINELIDEYEGEIPPELEEAFSYLNEQNIMLARSAAAGVMPAFVSQSEEDRALPLPEIAEDDIRLALPAA